MASLINNRKNQMQPTLGKVTAEQAAQFNKGFTDEIMSSPGRVNIHSFCDTSKLKKGTTILSYEHSSHSGFYLVKVTKVGTDAIGEDMIRVSDGEYSWRTGSCLAVKG
jgi:hypothetical protein